MSISSGDGKSTGFGRLFAANYSLVVRFCEERLSDRHRAEDAAAETFRIAWVRYRSPATRAWLLTIARHVIGNEYRRTRRSTALESRLRAVSGDTDSAVLVRDAVLALAESDRVILYLTYWVGLNATEAAQVLHISVAACWARTNRARARLRTALSADA